MNWGECEFKSLRELRDKFQRAIDNKVIDNFIVELLQELANVVIAKTKRRNIKYASNTGNMAKNWKMGEIKHSGDYFIIEIYNNTEYASFVENGFRSHFVPGHWEGKVFVYNKNEKGGMYVGKKDGWVEGKFMLKISVKEVENQMPRIIDKKAYDLFMKLMGSDNK